MIRFKKLLIKNFLSYGNAPVVIDLDNIGTTLIVGEDLDNTASGTGANGVGKTTWINALTFGLYGKPISNISLDNLVNNINEKDMRIEVEFIVNDDIVMVRRARKEKGGGNYAKVFVRGIDEELNEELHDRTPDSVSNINDYIEGFLGIPYELFIRIVTFTATHVPFLDLPLRQQSDIMEELIRLTQLSVKAEILKKAIKDAKQSLEIKIKHNEQLEKEHERYDTQVETAKKRVSVWKAEQLDTINSTQALLDIQLKIPVKEQEKIHKALNIAQDKLKDSKQTLRDLKDDLREPTRERDDIEQELSHAINEKKRVVESVAEFDTDKEHTIAGLEEEIKLLSGVDVDGQLALLENVEDIENETVVNQKVYDDYLAEQVRLAESRNSLQGDLNHLKDATCPYCLQDYKGSKDKLTKCVGDIEKLDNRLVEIDKSLDTTKNTLAIAAKKYKQFIGKVEYTSRELLKVVSDLENKEAQMDTVVKGVNPYVRQLEAFKDLDQKGMTETITKLNKDITGLTKKIDKQVKLVETMESKVGDLKDGLIIHEIFELYEIKNKIEKYKSKLDELVLENNPYDEPLKELLDMKLEPINMEAINDLDKHITHQNYLLKLLTKKDSFIRKALLKTNLEFLNQRLRKYLSALGLPHKVEFTQEMTAKITQFGRGLDFGNLSSGQKARVNLALSFSFRDVLQKSHDSINICMLDEVLDVGLDAVGVQNAAKMIKNKAREENLALYIISHRDEVSNIFDRKLVVQMEKGFSSIKVEDDD